MKHQPFTIILHIALVIIVTGAFVTHYLGIQGSITLKTGEAPINRIIKESGPGKGDLPFSISLDKVEIEYYPATTTPMDFRSFLNLEGNIISVAMNKVGVYRGWRFYQAAIGGNTSTLTVSYDPWGTGITYCGYVLLGIGMIGFFFQHNTLWRTMLKKYKKLTALSVISFLAFPALASQTELPAMQRPLAANLGKVLVYWNDRICPLQTMARDITSALYGSESFEGLTAEQVLSGWIFYYDRWQRNYFETHPELNSLPTNPTGKMDKKSTERLALIQWIGTGEAFRIYPYKTVDGSMEWLSLTARKPSGMDLVQWKFMQTSMPEIKQLLLQGKNIKANEAISALISGQRKYGGPQLPIQCKVDAELLYNKAVRPFVIAVVSLLTGIILLVFSISQPRKTICMKVISSVIGCILTVYLGCSMVLLWYIGGHVPLSNGPETMMFMGFISLAATIIWRENILRGGLFIVAGISLLVTVMGGSTPRIGAMMPVLSSPLLSIHVMLVMTAYAMFFLTTIFAAIALASHKLDLKEKLSTLNRVILPPAVCFLGAGIFIGAVWANQTWGRYWGWDPKETCALIMWIVYALPLHWGIRAVKIKIANSSLKIFTNRFSPSVFRNDKILNRYLLFAIITVIFTYFGANYLLTGLHSYA